MKWSLYSVASSLTEDPENYLMHRPDSSGWITWCKKVALHIPAMETKFTLNNSSPSSAILQFAKRINMFRTRKLVSTSSPKALRRWWIWITNIIRSGNKTLYDVSVTVQSKKPHQLKYLSTSLASPIDNTRNRGYRKPFAWPIYDACDSTDGMYIGTILSWTMEPSEEPQPWQTVGRFPLSTEI